MSDRKLTFEEWYEKDRKCKPITSGNEKSIPCSTTDLIRWEREAWEAACKMKDEDFENERRVSASVAMKNLELQIENESLKNELKDALKANEHLSTEYRNLDKSLSDYQRENEELKLQNKKAINAFKELNRYLCNGEHVDLCWVKDEIQLQAESESLMKSKHFLESAKLKRDIDDLKKKLSEAVEVIKFYADRFSYSWTKHDEVEYYSATIENDDSMVKFTEKDGTEFENLCAGKKARAFLNGGKYE